jgi:hypothetical protein
MKALALATALAVAAPLAWPCGVCVEDKMAATYDFDVVGRAIRNGQLVVFCELSGPVDARRIAGAVARQRGVDPRSIRISPNPAALSFAMDAKQRTPQSMVEAIRQAVPAGTQVSILRVL